MRAVQRFLQRLIMRNALSLRWKLTGIFGFLAIASAALFIGSLFFFFRARMRADLRQSLASLTGVAAAQFDVEAHAGLTSPEQMESPAYHKLQQDLIDVRDAGTNITYVYTMRRLPSGELIFIVDGAADPSLLGDIFADPSPFLAQNFSRITAPVAEEDYYRDEWGTWLSAYAPLYRADGTVDAILAVDMSTEKAQAGERQIALIALAIFLSAAPLSLLAGYILASTVTLPILSVAQAARGVAEQDLPELVSAAQSVASGDLTAAVCIRAEDLLVISGDETGRLASDLNRMIASLRESGAAFSEMSRRLSRTLRQVAGSVRDMLRASSNLALAVDQADQAAGRIAFSVEQVTAGAVQQSELAGHSALTMRSISTAIEGMARGVQKQAEDMNQAAAAAGRIHVAVGQATASTRAVEREAQQASLSAKDGAQTVEATIVRMGVIKSRVSESARQVQEMGARSQEIGSIVEAIQDIASQTNLLALNAAIEAARAGENGKSFSVVASEVRKLAESAARSAEDINRLVKGILASVVAAVDGIKQDVTEVEIGVQQANAAGEALQRITSAIKQVNVEVGQTISAAGAMEQSARQLSQVISSVNAVVEDNSAAAEQVAASAGEVKDSIERIAALSGKNRAAAEEVSASIHAIAAQTGQVSISAQGMAGMAAALQDLVDQFTLLEEQGNSPTQPSTMQPAIAAASSWSAL